MCDYEYLQQEGYSFTYVFAGLGKEANPPRFAFENNWANAKQAGLLRGAYYSLTYGNADAQAQEFISRLEKDPGELPPVVDLESHYFLPDERPTNKTKRENCDTVIAEVTKVLTNIEAKLGKKPMLYLSKNVWSEAFCNSDKLKQYSIWVVWVPDGITVPLPWGTGKLVKDPVKIKQQGWALWQNNDNQDIALISKNTCIDYSVYNGSTKDLLKSYSTLK